MNDPIEKNMQRRCNLKVDLDTADMITTLQMKAMGPAGSNNVNYDDQGCQI
jgi:hypothetical protein